MILWLFFYLILYIVQKRGKDIKNSILYNAYEKERYYDYGIYKNAMS